MKLSHEELLRRAEAYREHGTLVKAAAALGIKKSAFHESIKRAAEIGLLGPAPTLPGYAIKSLTETPNGTYMRQMKEAGDKWRVPEGHAVRGVSALIDAEGRIIQQWQKTAVEREPEDYIKRLKAAMADYEPATTTSMPFVSDADLLTLTPLADWHIGLRAWAGDTGTNWDLAIAERVIGQGIEDAVARSPASAHAIVLGGGDLLHSDSNENKTARSGNALDVDGRYDKCIDVAGRLVVKTIDANLRRHRHVTVRILKGNHDEHSSVAVAYFLKGHYRNEPRVTVDTDASLFFWHRFGKVMIGATHGHEAKIANMPSIMAHRRAEDWGATLFRYVHGFHLHHSAKYATEGGGCISEVHQTPTPQDAWHWGSGYLSGRSIQSITYHRDYGEISRVRVAMVDGGPIAANDDVRVAA
ncbi:hypothetical protein [Ochrobactrum sp. RH2CCR150]|uniref:hypothetical protein n=1 Tax=Ochrobactrum sp. RH2CCR150 TaxID=2587044 RepID=UPI0017B2592E|nr:hypothetical protein [Ochrobactrum sp. RH2CCR150]